MIEKTKPIYLFVTMAVFVIAGLYGLVNRGVEKVNDNSGAQISELEQIEVDFDVTRPLKVRCVKDMRTGECEPGSVFASSISPGLTSSEYEDMQKNNPDFKHYMYLGQAYEREGADFEAFNAFLKAARNGDFGAQTIVAAKLLIGQGVEKSYPKGCAWFKFGADTSGTVIGKDLYEMRCNRLSEPEVYEMNAHYLEISNPQ